MISIKHTERAAFIELNAPPVNALGLKMRQALSSAIHELDDSREIEEISGVVGPQNLGEYDIWSHGSSGHESDEAYSDYISNCR